LIRGVRKTEIQFRFGYKKSEPNPNRPKFDILAGGFPTETVCNQQFKLKVSKITLLAFNVHIKNVLKHD